MAARRSPPTPCLSGWSSSLLPESCLPLSRSAWSATSRDGGRSGERGMNDFVARLNRLDSCAISDGLDKLGLLPSISGIHRFSTERRIAGRVLTVTLAAASGRPASSRHLCTAAIEAAQPGDIIVIEQRTGLDAASWGGNLSIGAQVRGIAGVIVEGPVRDVDDSR